MVETKAKEKPIYTLIAGINGAGKTTWYETIDKEDKKRLGVRVNFDEELKECGDIRLAGRKTMQLVNNCLKNKITFHQETTLTGHTILNHIDAAAKQGFQINLIYVGLSSKELAVRRVKNRVSEGGHDIPKEIIEARYSKSLENLKSLLSKCENIRIYDNSKQFSPVFSYISENKKFIVAENMPEWCKSIVSSFLREKNALIQTQKKEEMLPKSSIHSKIVKAKLQEKLNNNVKKNKEHTL